MVVREAVGCRLGLGSCVRPATVVSTLKGLFISHKSNHAQQLSSMMRAVGYEVKQLIQTPLITEHSLLMRGLCRGKPGVPYISDSFPDGLEGFRLVVSCPRGPLDRRSHATAPSTHHIRDMGHCSMCRAQAETKVPLTFIVG